MIGDIKITAHRTLTHIIFWGVFFLVNGFIWGYCAEKPNIAYFRTAFWDGAKELPFLVGVVYLNLYVLLPRFFVTKRYFTYLLSVIGCFILTAVLIKEILFIGTPTRTAYLYMLGKIIMLNISPVFFVTSFIKIWQLWYRQLQM